ncbi:MAG: hypothetical protein JSW02_10730 [candidate division WOR-3 bacterium]|nr:MAG: hypothetical protein JSW02_10730 [candidate division WOR-3 bacterium]
MNLYLVSCDLKKAGRDYSTLLKIFMSTESHLYLLESTWILLTKKSMDEMFTKIRNAVDKNDYFIIVDIKGQQKMGRLPEKAEEWFKKHSL